MPAYVSHTIMAHDVYDKIDNKYVSLNYMLTYSLGGDLCKYSKCRKASHKVYLDEFIYKMADYIKENNLTNNKEVMGVLYGHICHYVFDSTMHPLIRKLSRECIRNKRNHTLIEGYLDSYLVNYKYHISIDKYDNSILDIKMSKEIKDMINKVYMDIYNCKNIASYYKYNLWLYRHIRYLYKIFGINMLKRLSGFNRFRNRNKDIDLLNDNKKLIYKDCKGNNCSDSFITSYNKSIDIACKYIACINKYLSI